MLDNWLTPAIEPHRQRLDLIGHRVVHGGEQFTAPTLITPEVESQLKELIPLAPLHNPPALKGLSWARQRAPGCPQWACFDTAFHSSLPAAASTYAIPQPFRARGFRRFGFHGINHQHVAESVGQRWQQQGRDPANLRLISAHLGAGASLAAIKGGVCIDTTMSFTPLEGLVMATRSGSIDPGLLLEMMREGYGADAMAASLRGVDVVALTGGIGEHDKQLQVELRQALGWWGNVNMIVIPADEEGMIARLCRRHSAPDQTSDRSAAIG